ncbi:MAG: hypothetical protein ACK5VZ_02130, partial [Alphaproteobacteria bacterium]
NTAGPNQLAGGAMRKQSHNAYFITQRHEDAEQKSYAADVRIAPEICGGIKEGNHRQRDKKNDLADEVGGKQ